MRRAFLCIVCALLLCGCTSQAPGMSEEELARVKAYRFPKPPVIQTAIDSDELIAAFGSVAPGSMITERDIDGWHKVQIVYDYPGGLPDGWAAMCAELAAGTANYKNMTTAELTTPRGALLASAYDGKLQFDVFEQIHEPSRWAEHEDDLTQYDSSTYYVTSKNKYYHIDGNCGPRLSRPYYAVDANDAVDERTDACPICAGSICNEIKNAELVPLETASDSGELLEAPQRFGEDARTVYVSERSNTIHSIPNCSGMKNYRTMTQEEADASGYKYCENCW